MGGAKPLPYGLRRPGGSVGGLDGDAVFGEVLRRARSERNGDALGGKGQIKAVAFLVQGDDVVLAFKGL